MSGKPDFLRGLTRFVLRGAVWFGPRRNHICNHREK
jgi:hypothetical protein